MPSAYECHDDCEKMVYVNWVNQNLFNRQSLSLLMPINPNSDEIFDKIADGVIFCEIIEDIYPHSIDLAVINSDSQSSKEDRLKNLQLAFETARAYGCQMEDLRINDVYSGIRQSVLELFWQIFYVGLVVSITYENFPEVNILKDESEAKDVIKNMKPEDILIRYVNYQIQLFNPSGKRLRSFKDNLTDGQVYAYLIDSIAQQEMVSLKYDTVFILNERNETYRNEMLFGNFYSLKLQGFIIEELLNTTCSDIAYIKMHLLTMAMMFHKYGIRMPETKPNIQSVSKERQEKNEKTSSFERLCKSFFNFISVKPLVTNLRNDCRDGLIFEQVMDKFSPDIFKKDEFIEKFDNEQIETKRIHNAAIILNRFDRFHSLFVKEFYPEYVQGGRRNVICGISLNLMLYWAMNINTDTLRPYDTEMRKFNEKELLQWVNSFDNFKVHSFRDCQIDSKYVLAKIIEKFCPGSVSWSYLKKLPTRLARAIYCVSIARREGYPMFIQPTMLSSGDHRATMLAFTILRDKHPSRNQNVCYE